MRCCSARGARDAQRASAALRRCLIFMLMLPMLRLILLRRYDAVFFVDAALLP